LDQIVDDYRYVETGRKVGKVVLVVGEDGLLRLDGLIASTTRKPTMSRYPTIRISATHAPMTTKPTFPSRSRLTADAEPSRQHVHRKLPASACGRVGATCLEGAQYTDCPMGLPPTAVWLAPSRPKVLARRI
jgi:hypothetical protein